MNAINVFYKLYYRTDEIIKDKEVEKIREAFSDYNVDVLWERTADFFKMPERTFVKRLLISDSYKDIIYFMRLYLELCPEMQLKKKLESKTKVINNKDKVKKI